MNLKDAIKASIDYSYANGIYISPVLILRAMRVGAIKALSSLPDIMSQYHDSITENMIAYFEGKDIVTKYRNAFWQVAVSALGAAFDLGWKDGGADGYPEGDALDWYNSRIDLEFGYISSLFQEAKELRKEEGFDYFAWITQRADNYTRTVREMYNAGVARSTKDYMVTFAGEDGAESCPECSMLKGQRHRISWFVRRNYVPPHGNGLSCHRGRYCQHYLERDSGERITA